MKIPLSWLKEYLDINLPAAQISKMLTAAGIEVEGLESTSLGFDKVVVGRVVAVEKHPNADKLCVAQVSDGTGTFQVVCGAPNCRAGMKTAFAVVGATLTDEKGQKFAVKKAKLRGVESSGMLCSEKELGVGQESDGIMEFADQIQEGADVASIYSDTIFDISLTPNLGHCSSVLGIARELSTITGLPLVPPKIKCEESGEKITSQVNVTVQDGKGCPRYASRLVRDVAVGPSPGWLKKRLEDCGLRSVNNIVDVTNYVLLEIGHPLHAFDFDKLGGHQIIVRRARAGEALATLDGKERQLAESDLLICDKDKPVAIAGVMGGSNTEVTEATRHVLLEAAYFDPKAIRKTSKLLGLQTDASKRFERGTDPNILAEVLDRAAVMIQEVAGGKIAEGIIDCKEQEFPEQELSCRLDRLNHLLGTHLSLSEVEEIFRRLHFGCHWNGRDAFVIRVPTYRADVREEIDLVEEVARTYGYDNISAATPRYQTSQLPHAPLYLFEKEARERLLAEGLQEFLTCDLIGPTLLNLVGNALMPPIVVLNPTSMEQSLLRTSLLPGLLQVVKYNVDHQRSDISGFEIGRIHFKKDEQYLEQSVAAIILTGKEAPHHWDQKAQDVDFYDLKGIVENLLEELGIEGWTFQPIQLPIFHPGRQAAVKVGELELGSIGEVHPSIQRRLDVPNRLYFAEINLHDLLKVRKQEWKMADLPLYPGSDRDWTITLEDALSVQSILDFFHAQPSKLLQQVSLIDLYRSDRLGEGRKNVTFRFFYRSPDRTVEQEEVEREHLSLVNLALNQFKTG
ncbi:MAG: phenylalanine--tRNA ligase subunit beta [Parachlamydia sp.]|nr:phenylalanine--tRNA ligase subunit beta [Parachlamydia sp.]